VSPAFVEQLNENHLTRQYGFFAQQEVNLRPRWKAYLGIRFDDYHGLVGNDSLSPRLALIYQQSPKAVYKFVFGHPFRNPSAFEQYYVGASVLAPGALHPETANTFELSMERKLGKGLSAIVNLYDYETHGLIEGGYIDAGLQQYMNADTVRSRGIELELSGKIWGRLEAAGSLALQGTLEKAAGTRLPNSPRQVGKLRMALPLLRDKLTLSSSAQYLGSRGTLAGESVGPVFLADATVTTNRLFPQFDLQFGVRNLFDRAYYDPVALILDRLRQDGRSVFVKLIWRTQD
jgi:outer membrane receptor protein involved in Fe transport